jgi:hypothetical protein
MLRPSPELLQQFETYHTYDKVKADAIQQMIDVAEMQEKARKLEWKRAKRRRNIALTTIMGVGLAGAGTVGYAVDTQTNKEIQANASVGITIMGSALDPINNNKALISLPGYGDKNADTVTKYIATAAQYAVDGQKWSFDYGDTIPDPTAEANAIIATANEQHVTSIAFIGYSEGGTEVMKLQDKIHELSGLEITAAFLIQTPDGVDTLRSATQDQIDLVHRISWIPDLEYSSMFRRIGGMGFRWSDYTTGSPKDNAYNFIQTLDEVNKKIDNGDSPGMWLLYDQMIAVEKGDMKTRISTLGKLATTKTMPTLIYVRSGAHGYNPIDNDKQASDNIGSYAQRNGVPFLEYAVPYADHTRPDLANDEYKKVFKEAKIDIQSSIANRQTIAAFNRLLTDQRAYNAYQTPQG